MLSFSPLFSLAFSACASLSFSSGCSSPESCMADEPYAIIVDGKGVVTERRLGMAGSQNGHDAGKQLATSVHVLSSSVSAGRRTVTLTRAVAGATVDHYSFPSALVEAGGLLYTIALLGSGGASSGRGGASSSGSGSRATAAVGGAGVGVAGCRGTIGCP